MQEVLDGLSNLIAQVQVIAPQLIAMLVITGSLGVIANPIISWLKVRLGLNQEGSRSLKKALAWITSGLGGIVATGILGYLTFTTIWTVILAVVLVYIGAKAFYETYWKESGAITKIEGIY